MGDYPKIIQDFPGLVGSAVHCRSQLTCLSFPAVNLNSKSILFYGWKKYIIHEYNIAKYWHRAIVLVASAFRLSGHSSFFRYKAKKTLSLCTELIQCLKSGFLKGREGGIRCD